ncbi:hypothetical protein [Streptomyces sp. NPDC047990]|uniref:hypothetical protein n=1 Tax=Streptomyces sp. NPDC047990 TaxID=3365496 RepID=UPI0037138613
MTPFDEITSDVPLVTPFQTMWNAAEETLLATQPQGFEVEDIGRRAWALLPEAERAQAFDELFYTYWEAVMADRETWTARDGGVS